MTSELSPAAAGKLSTIIAASVAGLAPGNAAERVAWCKDTGQHGVTLYSEGGMFRLAWGGQDLALVPRPVLLDDDAELGDPQFVTGTPDFVPDEWESN